MGPRRIARAKEPDSAAAAYARGLRLLSIRSRGREELRRELTRRGFSAGAAGRALERLVAEGWLREDEAASALVRSRRGRYGRRRIARELEARGFGAETASRALEELSAGREDAALAHAFERLWKSSSRLPLPERRSRVRRALTARGFAPEAISAMIRGSHGRDVEGDPGEVP
ncbi:MAG TPA: RecX family transcriptional regulator [Thermoanaerobaculia bacterium]